MGNFVLFVAEDIYMFYLHYKIAKKNGVGEKGMLQKGRKPQLKVEPANGRHKLATF